MTSRAGSCTSRSSGSTASRLEANPTLRPRQRPGQDHVIDDAAHNRSKGEIQGRLTNVPRKGRRRDPGDRQKTKGKADPGDDGVVPERAPQVKPVPDDPQPQSE